MALLARFDSRAPRRHFRNSGISNLVTDISEMMLMTLRRHGCLVAPLQKSPLAAAQF
jgi:hypothetical protein